MAFCSVIAAWAWLSAACFAQDLERKFEFEIREERLGDAIEEIVQKTGFLILFPYELASERGVNPVIGQYTVKEALDVLFRDTKFSGGLTESGVMYISLSGDDNAQDREREMAGGRMKKSWLAGVATFLVGADGASAQDGEAASASENAYKDEIEEIVVTALRRDERLQDVPAAITALAGEEIKAKGAQDLRDYLPTIPGVNYSENNLRGMRVTIRGISDGIGVTDPLTGIYVDEAPVTETFLATLDPDIYDVERVEVLKGPQGTLYGSGSMGGTVRIVGRKPQLGLFEGSIEGSAATISEGGTNRRVDGVVNVPIFKESAAFRMSAGYRKDGGWIDDLPRDDEDANTVEKHNARAQLLLKPGEQSTVTLGVIYQDEDQGLPWFDSLTSPGYTSDRIFRQGGDSEALLYSVTLQHDWEWMSLTSASNYLDKETFTTYDVTTSLRALMPLLTGVTLGASEGIGIATTGDLTLFTQEVRLVSSVRNRVDWLVGAFYSDATSESIQDIDIAQAPSVSAVTTGAAILEQEERRNTRQIAGFGELTLHVTDELSVTGGVRVFDVSQRNITRGDGTLNGGSTLFEPKADLSSSTTKALVKYQATPDNMLYAQAAQGYRNGGANGNVPLPACAGALAAAGYSSAPSSYDADKLWNYEIGSKNTLFDGRMRLNGAVFYIDWSEMQTSIGLTCGASFVTNAGKAESKGVEVEATIERFDGLTLSGSASYVDAELTEVAPGIVATEGDPLPLTAKWSGNVSALYERALRGDLTGFIRGEANYVGERWTAFPTVVARARLLDSYTTLSARVGVRTDRWSLAIFGTNLTNERILNNTNPPIYELVGTPRTIGINLRADF